MVYSKNMYVVCTSGHVLSRIIAILLKNIAIFSLQLQRNKHETG